MGKGRKNEGWNRQEDESSPAFEAFSSYRDMGNKRSIRALSQKINRNVTHLFEWSRKNQWQRRCAAWDTHLDQEACLSQVDAIKSMKAEQVLLARQAQGLASLGIKTLKDRLIKDIANGTNSVSLKSEALAKLLDVGCRLERLNRDEPEQNVQMVGSNDFSNLSIEEMENLNTLLTKGTEKSK